MCYERYFNPKSWAADVMTLRKLKCRTSLAVLPYVLQGLVSHWWQHAALRRCIWMSESKGLTHLLVAVGEVHEALVVVVVVCALGRVGGQQQVVGPQPVALRVRVRENPRLQQLVVRVVDACVQRADVSNSSIRCRTLGKPGRN